MDFLSEKNTYLVTGKHENPTELAATFLIKITNEAKQNYCWWKKSPTTTWDA